MTILQAPFELIRTTVVLPSAEFGDNWGLGLNVNKIVSITNVRYTYIKRKSHDKINCTIEMHLKKMLELQEFVDKHLNDYIKLTDYKNEIWKVKLLNNPFDFSQNIRGEWCQITLNFEGVRVYAATINC